MCYPYYIRRTTMDVATTDAVWNSTYFLEEREDDHYEQYKQ